MSYGRCDFAACVVGNQIFVGGGVSGVSGESDVREIEIYNTRSDSWTRVREMAPFRRKSFGLVQLNGNIYAVGGDAKRSVIWNNSIKDKEWSGPIATIRSLASYDVFALGGEVYIVGKTGDYLSSFQKSSLENDEWDELPPPPCPWRGGVRTALVPNPIPKEDDAKRLRTAS